MSDRRGLLDQLLVAALRRAVAAADPHDVAVLVADDLDLDVARPGEVALDVDLVAAEERLRLALRGVHRLLHLVGAAHDLHAAAAAAERGLDRERPADWPRRSRGSRRRAVTNSVVPGTIGAPPRRAALRELTLSPISSIAAGGGPMNATPLLGDRPGEVGVLAEEPVAGVHTVGAAAARSRRGSPRC